MQNPDKDIYVVGTYSSLKTGARTALVLQKESCTSFRKTRRVDGVLVYVEHGTQVQLGETDASVADLLVHILNKREQLTVESLLLEEKHFLAQWHEWREANPNKAWRPDWKLGSDVYLAQGRNTAERVPAKPDYSDVDDYGNQGPDEYANTRP